MSSEKETAPADLDRSGDESAAQKLQKLHAEHQGDHHVTVEDVPDEDDLPSATGGAGESSATWAPTMSAKAAGKQKENVQASTKLDTRSEESFPSLGGGGKTSSAPKGTWLGGAPNGKTNGSTSTNSAPKTSGANSAAQPKTTQRGPPSMVIPGRNVETITLDPQFIQPRAQLKRPLPDVIKDLNRKSRANITMTSLPGGRLRFDATGPPDIAQQALKDLVSQVGMKTTIKVPIPQSARAHIIGKQGSTIRSLQERTGARITLPKPGEGGDEDEDGSIEVTVEGNAVTAEAARSEILKIVGERSTNAGTKLRGIPAEFFPFIAGPRNSHLTALEDRNGVQIRVPPHQHLWEQVPVAPATGELPVFVPASNDNHIQLAGERAAVQAVRAAIEKRTAELHKQLLLEQLSIERGKHEFIIGPKGIPMDDFFDDTGCVIILPTDKDDDTVTIIGPKEKISQGLDKTMDLTSSIQSSSIDISRIHRNAAGGASEHARNLTRYLRQRNEIERLENLYNTRINTRFAQGGSLPWELFCRDGKSAIQARTEISSIVTGHPPTRMATVPVDPFFHRHLRNDVTPRVRENYGVHIVIPEPSEPEAAVLLVFEGPATEQPYQLPRAQPSADEVRAFKQGLDDARNHILELISKQDRIESVTVDVPQIFHERLQRFIKKENTVAAGQIPVRVSAAGTIITLRGPSTAVKALAAKVTSFVEQEKEYEKERGLITSFDFPQKYANHLIGKGGSNIKELRERFDVEIQVQDGKIELKGPKVKAEAARTHIKALERQLADETTHTLKIDPKFHRELIGAGGSTPNRLQKKHNVVVFFPRQPKNGKDDTSNADAASENGNGKPRRHQEPDEVIIRGPKKGADEARDELLELLKYNKEHGHTATVVVKQKQVPSIIGQGGAALDELRQSTNTRIDIPAARDTETVEIQIKGKKDDVAAAKKILEGKRAVFEDTITKTIDVDRKYHKALIGASGANLRDMVLKAGGSDDRRELARTIQFPKQDSEGTTIKIEGRTDVVEKLLKRIQEMVSERENQVSETIDVPTEKHRSLIGRGGETRRQLESRFGVSIDIPRQGENKTGVTLTGKAEAIEKAREHIASLTKEQPGETIQVPRNLHHAIANNGQLFRKLRNEHSVTVDHAGQAVPAKPSPGPAAAGRSNGGALPLITDDPEGATDAHSWKVMSQDGGGEEGDIAWVLRGPPEGVDKARKAVGAALEQARRNTTVGYLVLADPRSHRFVIGKGGSKIDAIRRQSGCRVNVPRDQGSDEAIEVTGSKDGVEQARDLILEAVREGLSQRASGRD